MFGLPLLPNPVQTMDDEPLLKRPGHSLGIRSCWLKKGQQMLAKNCGCVRVKKNFCNLAILKENSICWEQHESWERIILQSYFRIRFVLPRLDCLKIFSYFASSDSCLHLEKKKKSKWHSFRGTDSLRWSKLLECALITAGTAVSKTDVLKSSLSVPTKNPQAFRTRQEIAWRALQRGA